MKFYSKKIIQLKQADVHLHYANNKGRGRDNVTVTVVSPGAPRPGVTRGYTDYRRQFRVSGWSGNVNVPTALINEFGGLK